MSWWNGPRVRVIGVTLGQNEESEFTRRVGQRFDHFLWKVDEVHHGPCPGTARDVPRRVRGDDRTAGHRSRPPRDLRPDHRGCGAAIDGCQAASLSVLTDGGFVTRSATDPIAEEGDRIQYDAGEGPCLSAAGGQFVVYTRSLRDDLRWPSSSPRLASQLGVGSILSARLSIAGNRGRGLGSPNMYSVSEDGFTEEGRILAVLLASLASVATHHGAREANLQEALMSRQTIGEAVGIIRAQNDVSSEAAFDMLATASSRMNTKLRVIAARITDGTLPYLPEAWVKPRNLRTSSR